MRRFLRAPDVVFGIGPWIPAVIPLLAVGLVGAGLSLLLLPAGWAWVGVVAAGVTVVRVRTRAIWAVVAVLVLGELIRDPSRVGGELLLLVAGIHLLVALTAHAAVLPVRGRLQLAGLLRPARTFCLIQVPCQGLAALVLLLSGRAQVVPLASALGGTVLVVLALTFALLRLDRRGLPVP